MTGEHRREAVQIFLMRSSNGKPLVIAVNLN